MKPTCVESKALSAPELMKDVHMASAIDIFSSRPVFSDPFRGELMKALEPFIKGFSSHDQLGLEQQGSIGLNQLTPSQVQQIQAQIQLQYQQQQIAAMAAASIQNQKLRQWQQQQQALNSLRPKAIPMKHHQGSGDFGDFKPLHSIVDAKLQAICQSLANPKKQEKSAKPIVISDPKKMSDGLSETGSTVVLDNSSSSELGFLGSEDCKVESSLSPALTEGDESTDSSSPDSDLKFLDFTEQPWDESENFMLQKYPSWEIDLEAILS
ncbi:hypothetical protein HHK36_008071 [Tetracentron sinense]|uniref:Uncharacterized protein n=1 Tax=Tetracentron sinense TaxID=13715 RepID=A0A835DJP5_TETSI|nr:hypothetical protein HHK36_008071 [Tetracentron sinense]